MPTIHSFTVVTQLIYYWTSTNISEKIILRCRLAYYITYYNITDSHYVEIDHTEHNFNLYRVIRVDTSSSNCLEEFDGSNLKPAVALSATGVLFRRSFGMIASDFWSNPSIECDPWKRKRKYSKFCRPEMDDGLTSENIRLTVKGFGLNPFPHPPGDSC